MSVKIRLRRMGAKGRPFYRVVIADSRRARNGRFIEAIGTYDPNSDPAIIKIDEEKALLWLSRGAQATDTTQALLKKQGIVEKFLASKGKAEVSAPVEETPAPVEEKKKPAARKKKAEVVEETPTAEAAVEAPAAAAETIEEQPTVEVAEEAPAAAEAEKAEEQPAE